MRNIFFIASFLFLYIACDKTKNENKKSLESAPVNQQVIDSVATENQTSENSKSLVFKVQIAALKKANQSLDNLEGVKVYSENNLKKYMLGAFDTYKEAKEYRNQLNKTYKGAFVQAIKHQTPISIKEALKNE